MIGKKLDDAMLELSGPVKPESGGNPEVLGQMLSKVIHDDLRYPHHWCLWNRVCFMHRVLDIYQETNENVLYK